MAFCHCRSEWWMSSWPQIERTPEGRVSAFRWLLCKTSMCVVSDVTPQPFYGPVPGAPGWAGARRELLDFMVQGKINRQTTDHMAGCHSIWTNQCPPPPSPIFLQVGCPSCRPTNSVKALKATSGHYQRDTKLTSSFLLLTGSAGEGCHVCLYAMIIQLHLIGFSVPESMLSVVWIKIV